jgi:hypothetical protein
MDLLADLARELLRCLERRVVCADLSRMEDLGGLLGKQLEELQEKANGWEGVQPVLLFTSRGPQTRP